MKKRLLSMLMAVLMIASLVPATALAAKAPVTDPTKTVIDIKADATAKQPGVYAVINKADGKVSGNVAITAFAEKSDWCAICKNPTTVVVKEATCADAGLTITYCADCGRAYGLNYYKTEAALKHVYAEYVVEVAPTCEKDGWGYAVCKNCGEPAFIDGAADQGETSITAVVAQGQKLTNELKAEIAKVKALFETDGHADKKAWVAVTEDGKINGTVVKAEKPATHVATVGGKVVTVDAKGNFNAYGTAPTGNGYEATLICPDCGKIMDNNNATIKGLTAAHAKSISIEKAGYLPYADRDKDGNIVAKHDGKTDAVWCKECGAIASVTIPYDQYFQSNEPVVGNTKIVGAKAPTCEENGWTGEVQTYCKLTNANYCGWVITKENEEIPALGHHMVAVADKAPTCKEDGWTGIDYKECDRVIKNDAGDIVWECKHTEGYKAVAQAKGHAYAPQVLVAPTCYSKGLTVIACTVCGEYRDAGTVVGGNYDGSYYYTAKVNHVAADELANVKAATCTEAGYTGDSVCKWCGKVLKAGEEIPALGHKTEVKDAKAATCTEVGYTGDEVCTVCGETVKKGTEIPALGHKFENGVCTVCGEKDPNYVAPVVNPFKDVEKTSPYYDAIIWAADKGVTTGKTADTFGINDGCTRAQIVTFLYRAAGSPAVKADTVNPFTDVSKDSVYYNAILWAVEKGITKGTTETTFDPNAVCTRGQIVTFLFRASGDEKVATGTDFADVASGSYCADAVAWAVANKVANGFADGTFRPEATCTRGQAVTFIYRALAE